MHFGKMDANNLEPLAVKGNGHRKHEFDLPPEPLVSPSRPSSIAPAKKMDFFAFDLNQTPFALRSEFLDTYRDKQPEWGPLGYVSYKRTYARTKKDGSAEEFWETCQRVVEGTYRVQQRHCQLFHLPWYPGKAQRSAQRMFQLMWEFRFLPPGRGLWMMGTDTIERIGGAALCNCAFVSTNEINVSFSAPFCFLMDMSMLGVGVGGDCRGAGRITLSLPQITPDFHVIDDTREGWILAVRRLLEAYVGNATIPSKWDYSLIRPAGALIRGFGGVAAGPEPLRLVLEDDLPKLLNANIGKKISSEVIVDIFNFLGKCVVSGNVRRSAEIMFGSATDTLFLGLKDPKKYSHELQDRRWASNNSIYAEMGMDYTEIAAQTVQNGEPGYLWLQNARDYGRMADPPDFRDRRVMGTNPCQPGFADVLTPFGIKLFDDVGVGSTIWSGQQWTKITRKLATGKKPVFLYQTTAGAFIGTKEHRIFQEGERIEVQHADSIDQVTGPKPELFSQAAQDIVDGWVFGDGSVHKASNALVYLCIGEEDHCIFDTSLATKIGEQRAGIKEYAYEVTTTLSAGELPLTYMRRVPVRFKRGEATTVRSFLRGLYAANGSICDGRVTLKAASFGVITDVQEMLSSIGIRSYYTTNKASLVEFENGTYTCRESYDLNITRDREAFRSLIGFVHPSKTKRLDEACRRSKATKPAKLSYDIIGVEYLGDFEVYDITVEAGEHSYWTGGLLVSNCGEQPLESFELCNLVETFPSRHETYEEYRQTLKHAYLYAKTVTLIPTHDQRTNAIQLRNRRIGTSQSGITDSFARHGRRQHFQWSDNGYKYLRELDRIYSEWLCVPTSNRITTVKPSGTVSLLPGVSPGIHYPIAEYYLRRIRIAEGSPLVRALSKAGYRMEPCSYTPNTMVVEFPVWERHFTKSEKDVTFWEQMENAAEIQKWWSDNSVSITVKFDPKSEAHQIASALELFEDRLKSVSFLPKSEHGYVQAPYEEITKEAYEDYAAKVRPLDLSKATNEIQEKFCSNDTCTI